ARSPGASYLQIKNAILKGVDVLPQYTGLVSSNGRLDLVGMLQQLGLTVVSSTPADASVVSTPPSNYVINFSDPIDPTSLQAGALTVEGKPADAVTPSADDKSATFTFTTNPGANQGLHTLAIAGGSITKQGDPSSTILPFSASFRYDAVLLQVTSTKPPFPNGVFTLPGPFTHDGNLNKAAGPAPGHATRPPPSRTPRAP